MVVVLTRDRAVLLYRMVDGQRRRGSGLRVGGRYVLTADHCANGTDHVIVVDGVEYPATVHVRTGTTDVDLAVLVADDLPELEPMSVARLDRTTAADVADCVALGFPSWKADGRDPTLAQPHGYVPTLEGANPRTGDGRWVAFKITSPGIREYRVLAGSLDQAGSPWAGMSGAVVVAPGGLLLGVVCSHAPAEGVGSLAITPVTAITGLTADVRERFTSALGVDDLAALPVLPVRQPAPPPGAGLGDLVSVLDGADLPTVEALDPYRLGASPSDYGTTATYGLNDPYVERTYDLVDTRLRESLQPGRLVLVVGPSKAGKTRTAYEAARAVHPHARLLVPAPGALTRLAGHDRLTTSRETILVWFDDLNEYVTGPDPLTPTLLNRLLHRPGPTLALATLRQEARDRLVEATGELAGDTRQLLEDATPFTITLGSTSTHPDEQAAAAAAYPDLPQAGPGLGEQLAGAPALLATYRAAATTNPWRHLLIRTVVDWARVGMPGPIPEPDLIAITTESLWDERPDLDPPEDPTPDVRWARTPPPGAGQVALLTTHALPGRVRGYRPFDYLLAADDGQDAHPRPIPDAAWTAALSRAGPDEAAAIGTAAYYRDNIPAAITAVRQAADAGVPLAAYNLGYLLAERLDPPDLDGARTWYQKAADAGDTDAMVNLGVLLSDRLDPPDLDAARTWWQKAADDTDAMNNLGYLLSDRLDPPDLAAARTWYQKAADAGHTGAMVNLGILLSDRLDPPDLDAARTWYQKAADAGHTGAMVSLGILLADRLDPPDLDAARTWYQKAADAGVPLGAYNLGYLLAERLDPPDLDGARTWYQKAADAGDTDAMVNLGVLLSDRLDPPDLDAARTWHEKAADAGVPLGAYNLGILLAERLDPPDLDAARTWYRKAADAGDTDAMVNLGVLLSDRLDPPDLAAARTWYRKAADAGHTGAMNRLGILLSDRLDPPDLDAARTWYEKAADAGHPLAAYNLGILLADRLDPPDLDGARTWWHKAADAGDTDAMVNLGVLLSDRLDPPDLDGARTWFRKAADAGDTDALDRLRELETADLPAPSAEGEQR